MCWYGRRTPDVLPAVSADGRFAYVTSPDAKAVTVVDAATRQVAARIEVGGGPLGIAVAPDGRTVYVADWYAAAVRVIDTASRSVTASIALENRCSCRPPRYVAANINAATPKRAAKPDGRGPSSPMTRRLSSRRPPDTHDTRKNR